MITAVAPILSAIEALPATYLCWLEAPEIAAAARPGQFVMVRCGGDTLLRRPISVHRVEGDRLAILFAVVGKGTDWLSRKRAGETLDLFGPLGNGFTLDDEAENLLLVAGGIGIAPLCFLADDALSRGKKVTLIAGAATADGLLPLTPPARLYEAGMLAASLNTVNATDDGSEGFHGPATALIPAYLDGVDQVFACGPAGMYRTMAAMPELQDKPVQVSLEIAMACGIGICYSCTIRTRRGLQQVCQDGPVFEMGDIDWDAYTGL